MNLNALLERAKEKALESDCRVPMVAFLLRNGTIVAYGVNKKGFRGSSIHAEIDCLRKIRFQKRRGDNTTMFIARHRKDGSVGNAKPCANCLEVMRGMGIKKVAWTTSEQVVEVARISQIENHFLTRSRLFNNADVISGLEYFALNGS
tara:strand:+ start:2580 stop:3023 length:444 start_codon:yes stop_codon:yes gene_type:complete